MFKVSLAKSRPALPFTESHISPCGEKGNDQLCPSAPSPCEHDSQLLWLLRCFMETSSQQVTVQGSVVSGYLPGCVCSFVQASCQFWQVLQLTSLTNDYSSETHVPLYWMKGNYVLGLRAVFLLVYNHIYVKVYICEFNTTICINKQ